MAWRRRGVRIPLAPQTQDRLTPRMPDCPRRAGWLEEEPPIARNLAFRRKPFGFCPALRRIGPDIIDGIMERIIVQMESNTISELDQAARESRMSRAAFVRASVEAVLAERRRNKELKQVVDSYSASPQGDFTVSKETLQAVWPE
jgi:hypothetical protein